MKITVLGAGAIGSAIASDLVARDEVTHVQVADHKTGALNALAAAADSPKLRTARVDVRDERRLASVLAGSACVVSSVAPQLHAKLARTALSVGSHFCDLGGHDAAVGTELALAPEAAARSRWVVPNCGFAPGLVNIVATRGVEQLDEVESVVIRAGNIPLSAEAPFFHRLAYAATKLVEDYTAPAPAVREGEVVWMEPLSGIEEVLFPAPFHALEAFYTAGKLSTLPQDLAGRVRTLDYKTLRHPGHAAAMRSVLALGFGERTSVDVRTHLSYRDLLVRRLRERLGGPYEDAVLLRARIDGTLDGAPRTVLYEMTEVYDAKRELSAMQRCTGFPTAAVAVLLGSGQVPGGGAAPPERIIPKDLFFEAISARGLRVSERWEGVEEPVGV